MPASQRTQTLPAFPWAPCERQAGVLKGRQVPHLQHSPPFCSAVAEEPGSFRECHFWRWDQTLQLTEVLANSQHPEI